MRVYDRLERLLGHESEAPVMAPQTESLTVRRERGRDRDVLTLVYDGQPMAEHRWDGSVKVHVYETLPEGYMETLARVLEQHGVTMAVGDDGKWHVKGGEWAQPEAMYDDMIILARGQMLPWARLGDVANTLDGLAEGPALGETEQAALDWCVHEVRDVAYWLGVERTRGA